MMAPKVKIKQDSIRKGKEMIYLRLHWLLFVLIQLLLMISKSVIITSILLVFLKSNVSFATMYHHDPHYQHQQQHGQIPQHRVRPSKRNLIYKHNHPWSSLSSQDPSLVQRRNEEVVIQNKNNQGRNGNKNKNNSGNNKGDEQKNINARDIEQNLDETNNDIIKNSHLWIDSNTHHIGLINENRTYDDNYEEQVHQPIRIRLILVSDPSSGYNFLSPQESLLLMDMIQPTIENWSKALSIPRISGNLTIDKDQLYDGISCGPGIDSGLPSVVVPEEHIEGGIEGVDLLVYLSLGFKEDYISKYFKTSENDYESTSEPVTTLEEILDSYEWNDFVNYTGPSPFFLNETTRTNNITLFDGTYSNFTSMNEKNWTRPSIPSMMLQHQCSGSYIASATYCSTDQYDRPIAGILHVCIGNNFFDPQNIYMNQLTMMHELGHILGFNSHSMAYFRDRKTGLPLTERVDGDVPEIETECTGVKVGRRNATIPLPSVDILQFKDVRGVRVAQVVTPTVRQIVRNRFDCQELEGAELESLSYHSDNGTDANCIGDHWERRLFKNDLMNPILEPSIPSSLLSPLTLAYFIDSGWYKVNTSRAFSGDTWGKGAGCSFVSSPCLSDGKVLSVTSENFFCASDRYNQRDFDGCTNDLLSKAVCGVTVYNDALPNEFQYFPSYQYIGGIDADLDYCPIFVGAGNGNCKDESHDGRLKYGLDSYGKENSRCVVGSSDGHIVPLCAQIACSLYNHTLHVKVDGFWKTCDFPGQKLSSWWNDDFVECPDPKFVCPTFHCQRDCLMEDQHATSCNFTSGTCSCPGIEEIMNTTSLPNQTFSCYDIFDVSEHPLLREYYVNDTTELMDDGKNILDFAVRMFVQMSIGEVISFVATSLLVVVTCTIVSINTFKIIRQRRSISSFCIRLFSRSSEWRSDMYQCSDAGGHSEKDKMVASVLYNLRVRNATDGIYSDVPNEVGSINHSEIQERSCDTNQQRFGNIENDEQIILRSQLPPLPVVGRIVSIPGFTYIDDSLHIMNTRRDDTLTVIEETAVGSRSSRVSQLESCSIKSVRESICDEQDIFEHPAVRRRRPM